MADPWTSRRPAGNTPDRLREIAAWLEGAEGACLARAAERYPSSDHTSTNAYLRGGLSEALRGGADKVRSLALDIEVRRGGHDVVAVQIAVDADARRSS